MTAFFADEIELDRCPQCEGLWLDLNEVERLHGLKGLQISQLPTKGTCPRGHGILRSGGVGPLEADVCPKCRGMFIPETPVERAPAAVTRPQGVAAVKRAAPQAICDACGKKVAATGGAMTAKGFECSSCRAGASTAPEDKAFNLIGHVLDSLEAK